MDPLLLFLVVFYAGKNVDLVVDYAGPFVSIFLGAFVGFLVGASAAWGALEIVSASDQFAFTRSTLNPGTLSTLIALSFSGLLIAFTMTLMGFGSLALSYFTRRPRPTTIQVPTS